MLPISVGLANQLVAKVPLKYRAALFDFDGTLTPSLPLWVKAFQVVLRDRGIEVSDADVVKRFFYRDWADVAGDLHPMSEAEFRDQIHAGLRESFHEAQLFPQVASILTRCRAHGMQTAIVTSAPKIILDDVMPRLKLDLLFDFIVCADDVKNFKPHAEPVLKALDALRRIPVEAIMIGDSTVDILSGKAAGTATALFLPDNHTDFHRTDALKATQPDHVFTHHGELLAILGLDLLDAAAS